MRRWGGSASAPVGRPAAGSAAAEPVPGGVLSGQRARSGWGASAGCGAAHPRCESAVRGQHRLHHAPAAHPRPTNSSPVPAWQLLPIACMQVARRLRSSGIPSSTRCCCRQPGKHWRRRGQLAAQRALTRCAATLPPALWPACRVPRMNKSAWMVEWQPPIQPGCWVRTSKCRGCRPHARCVRWRARCRRCSKAQACLMQVLQRLQLLPCWLVGSRASHCLPRRHWRQHCCTETLSLLTVHAGPHARHA